jgi:hypothetical protein
MVSIIDNITSHLESGVTLPPHELAQLVSSLQDSVMSVVASGKFSPQFRAPALGVAERLGGLISSLLSSPRTPRELRDLSRARRQLAAVYSALGGARPDDAGPLAAYLTAGALADDARIANARAQGDAVRARLGDAWRYSAWRRPGVAACGDGVEGDSGGGGSEALPLPLPGGV